MKEFINLNRLNQLVNFIVDKREAGEDCKMEPVLFGKEQGLIVKDNPYEAAPVLQITCQKAGLARIVKLMSDYAETSLLLPPRFKHQQVTDAVTQALGNHLLLEVNAMPPDRGLQILAIVEAGKDDESIVRAINAYLKANPT